MSKVYISPDIMGFIIGIDWLEQQDKFVWDFHKGKKMSSAMANGYN